LSDDATAGWDVEVVTTRTNPVPDLEASLQEAGFDTSQIAAVGSITTPPEAASTSIRNPGDEDWKSSFIDVFGPSYLKNADIEFSARAEGYGDDQAIIDALLNEPDVMVVDTFSLSSQQEVGGDPNQFTLDDVDASGTFEAPVVELRLPDGTVREVRVIGVISSSVSSLFGVYIGPATGDTLFTAEGEPERYWYVKLAEGVDTSEAASEIERLLLPAGVQANDIRQEMEDAQ